jgi:ADP-heptose:LPS heptosyltransferase
MRTYPGYARPSSRSDPPMRILLVKTSSLGDVIHNLPVVSDLRLSFPEAQIDWCVEEGFADIPRLHPAVDQVIPVAIRRWRKQLGSLCHLARTGRLPAPHRRHNAMTSFSTRKAC